MSPLLVRCNTLHSSFNYFQLASFITHHSPLVSTLLIFEFYNWVLNFVQIISFLQEVTLGHPKRNIKNHAVMFWNATFSHSQTLKYPENLRYGRLFSSAIGLSGCTFQSITCLLFPFADQFFRLPKKKCHLLCQAGKTSRYDNVHNFCFKATLKALVVDWLGTDRYFLRGEFGQFSHI